MNDVRQGSPGIDFPDAKFRVLVVDDDPTHLEYIRTMLAVAGLEVLACSTPQAALKEAARDCFHVVCADYHMPGMDGLQMLGQMQAMVPDVSCVLITAVSSYIEPERRKQSGVVCVIVKPFESTVLVNLVTRLARLTELQRRARRITYAARMSNRPTTPAV